MGTVKEKFLKIENLIDVPENVKMFIEKMGDIIDNLNPKAGCFCSGLGQSIETC